MVTIQDFCVCVRHFKLVGVRTHDGKERSLCAGGHNTIISLALISIEGSIAGIGDACHLTGIDHRLDILLAVNPVLVEYAWGTAGCQDVCIGSQGILADRILLFAGRAIFCIVIFYEGDGILLVAVVISQTICLYG